VTREKIWGLVNFENKIFEVFTCGRGLVEKRLLPKEKIAGSSPVARSKEHVGIMKIMNKKIEQD
jgi:hypothetical protein